jgi:hypothetical protein
MAIIFRQILALVALISLLPMAPDASGQTSMHVTPVEIAQLPRFCWAQLEVPNAQGGEFHIVDCGPAANHFCSGLIYIIRAKSQMNKSARLDLLGHADTDVRYTEKAIADYPRCSIREHVVATRAELNNLLTIFGSKRPRAQ